MIESFEQRLKRMEIRSRLEVANERRAEDDWQPADRTPAAAMWVTVKSSHANAAPVRRVLFNGRYFLTREAFSSWKPCPTDERPVSALVDDGIDVIDGLEVLELEPMTAFDEAASLAEIARLELKVEVVKLFRPGDEAFGALSGKVLATSKNFAAQLIGDNAVVIHEQNKLSRRVQNGEQVTLNYAGGRAEVLNGVFFDVNITAPFLSVEQRGWMRMQMIEALCGVEGADQDDAMIREALRYALDKTSQMFGLEKSRLDVAKINLSVVDLMPSLLMQEVEAAMQRADELSLVSVPRIRG